MNPRQPIAVECERCGHEWVGFYLPLPVDDAVRLMGRLCCPMCAAGAEQIVIRFDGFVRGGVHP